MPGLDDGPSTLEESINMAKIASEDGISMVVATPHNRDLAGKNLSGKFPYMVQQFNRTLEAQSIPVKVLYGMENHIEMDIVEQVGSGQALTIEGTNFMLIELPFEFVPIYTNQIITELFDNGITPIIVHPERNAGIQLDIGLLEELVSRGCLVQVSAGSIDGIHDGLIQNVARDLILKDLVHVISTDAHSDKGDRVPKLSHVVKKVADMIGSESASNMVTETPFSIVNNKMLGH